MAAKVDKKSCTGCGACVKACPVEAITLKAGKADVSDSCVDCGACVSDCPVEAITLD